ncbi:hypothetical protein RO3G_08238 [Rhizopus delemar RA 99-880]|uniref:Heme peroxidase n=1 Tax=Rhizopus delemar (strain RA 99-880 / ATCC MYA-4621 / FGSC 9543 / NRRL 43880) TaxID=246409 RepID=I1C503_RHIO9|nr:hypothetical protein RO3G_08238 [Rhizopus delemar RA 99-880]|eukprot:EIE83533.1 hypothetical protein RO3G_08238 [Rhizopus delemar RA 99-880]
MIQRKSISSNSASMAKKDVDDHLYHIKNHLDHQGLLEYLKAIVNDIDNKQDKRSKGIIKPSPSSSPTGAKWTWKALTENIKAILNINSNSSGAIKEILSLSINQQLTLLRVIIEQLLSKNYPINDRNNTLEAAIEILSQLRPENQDFNIIPKPFITYAGHHFRTADGSQNSPLFPEVGKAGSNYVMSVTTSSNNNENLPPAKEVFDKLLRRPDGEFTPNKNGVNMMLLYLAVVISHDLFHTDYNDPRRNLTTSYLDLSLLYGNNREQQVSYRQMKGGLLKPDQWHDKRLVIQPPGVSALMVMFSRNHNYIAKKLLEINENERFSYGPGKALTTEEEQDEHLFQTARLINNGCYVNIITHDFVRTILGVGANSHFTLDFLAGVDTPIYGNVVSSEFNLIYRWHPALGKEDAEYTAKVASALGGSMNGKSRSGYLKKILEGPDPENEHRLNDRVEEFNKHFAHASQEELEKGLPIAGTHRDIKTGSFPDVDIIKALRAGYTQVSSDFGQGQNTPVGLEYVEIAAINQARALGARTFNEFRKFFNLMPLETFEDFSEKPSVQQALKELYCTPDRVELYAGLMVERTKVTGFQLPYTIFRAIVSDSANLLRNDRILVKSLTPTNITNWGYKYTLGDPELSDRVFPSMLTNLFPDATPSSGGFTPEELKNIFTIPTNETN